MGGFLTVFAFGGIMFLCTGYLFNYLIGTVLGGIYALITYAYYLFDLPEGYLITLIVILVICIGATRIKLWFDNNK